MRIFTLIILLLAPLSLIGAVGDDGSRYLQSLTHSIERLGSYRVVFTLGVGDEELKGEYIVTKSGSYYLTVGEQSIKGDGQEREIVDHYNREIIRERVDSSTPMLMANPASAFLSLDAIFDSTVIAEDQKSIDLKLLQKGDAPLFEGVDLRLSIDDSLPLQINYLADGDEVNVSILSFENFSGELPTIDVDNEQYEIIDLR